MKTYIILPARLDSSRLKNKLIRKIGEMTLIEHMIIRAKRIKNVDLIVSTDSRRIQDYSLKHNVECLYSQKKFTNGTERCFYTAKKYKANKTDIIINLQSDEFNINILHINKLIKFLKVNPSVSVATLMYKTFDKQDYSDSNNVKVVVDKKQKAITFSRQNISSNKSAYYIHLGIYAFKYKALYNYSKMTICEYEKKESLEQLRMIWNNVPIHCVLVKNNQSIGINSLKDLKKARKLHGN